jgi:hypothetical protein
MRRFGTMQLVHFPIRITPQDPIFLIKPEEATSAIPYSLPSQYCTDDYYTNDQGSGHERVLFSTTSDIKPEFLECADSEFGLDPWRRLDNLSQGFEYGGS